MSSNNTWDPYLELGVDRKADDTAIKAAFRKLSMVHHPDRAPIDRGVLSKEAIEAAEAPYRKRFSRINEAYSILSDGGKRAAYDRFGHAGVNASAQGAHSRGSNARGFTGHFSDQDFEDIFKDIFGDNRNGWRQRQQESQQNQRNTGGKTNHGSSSQQRNTYSGNNGGGFSDAHDSYTRADPHASSDAPPSATPSSLILDVAGIASMVAGATMIDVGTQRVNELRRESKRPDATARALQFGGIGLVAIGAVCALDMFTGHKLLNKIHAGLA